jgi:hypothetical protein
MHGSAAAAMVAAHSLAAAWDGSTDPLITSEFRSGPPREEDAAPRGATTEINQ